MEKKWNNIMDKRERICKKKGKIIYMEEREINTWKKGKKENIRKEKWKKNIHEHQWKTNKKNIQLKKEKNRQLKKGKNSHEKRGRRGKKNMNYTCKFKTRCIPVSL